MTVNTSLDLYVVTEKYKMVTKSLSRMYRCQSVRKESYDSMILVPCPFLIHHFACPEKIDPLKLRKNTKKNENCIAAKLKLKKGT